MKLHLNQHQPTAQMLLIQAVEKQLTLRKHNEWKKELPDRCPPILWFGDAASAKSIVLTLGANPSRKEYLYDSAEQALQKFQQTNSHELLNYREIPDNRFQLLNKTENLADILDNQKLQNEIIDGYNRYFLRNPYRKWFGFDKVDSYCVEGFLRGFGASYYDNNLPFQAVHIDLFPFTTLSDFKCLLKKWQLFGNEWAAKFIQSLVTLIQPSLLIIFGVTNFNYFGHYIDNSVSQPLWQGYGCASYCMENSRKIGLPVIGLRTNLGNPIGFNAKNLKEYGQYISNVYKRI